MNTFYHEHILSIMFLWFTIWRQIMTYFDTSPLDWFINLYYHLSCFSFSFQNVMNVFINTTDWNKTEKYVFSIKNVQNDSKKGNYFFFNFSLLFLDYVNTITYTFFTVVKFSEFTRLTIKEETSETTVRNLFSLCSFTLVFLQLYCWSFILCA